MSEEILLSVIMITYNHEPYIAKAIESVINQETSFKYQLLIGEDCSTDKTGDIVRKYAKEYPDKIRYICHTHNVGLEKNAETLFRKAKTKYWAFCEGDDYWCDSNKLQMQVDYLEQNQEYSAVYHNVQCVDFKGKARKTYEINKYPIKKECDFDFYQIRDHGIPGQTASIVMRNMYWLMGSKGKIRNFHICPGNGDEKIAVVMSLFGRIHLMPQVMATHRVILKGDSWSARSRNRNLSLYQYDMYLGIKYWMKKDYDILYEKKGFEKKILEIGSTIFKENMSTENLRILIRLYGYYCTERIRERL